MALVDTTWYTNYGDGSTTGYYAVTAWAALTAYTAGQIRRQLAAPAVGSERLFVCIIAGTSLAAEPTWTTTRGAKTAEAAGPTWQECTGMPGTCGDTTNTNTWLNYKNTAVSLGAMIYDSGTASLQICSTAGTAGNGAAPSFSATAGTTTADNTATWTSLGLASAFAAWANPHARLSNAYTATWGQAGNQFAIASNHASTQTTALNLVSPGTSALPCPVYCISSSTTLAAPTLATTASIATTGASNITLSGTFYYYGITFKSGNSSNTANINIYAGGNGAGFLESCTLNLNNTSTSSNMLVSGQGNLIADYLDFINCTFVFGNASQIMQPGAYVRFINPTIAATGTVPTTLFIGANTNSIVYVIGADLSNITGNLINIGTNRQNLWFLENCKLANGVSVVTSSFNSFPTNVVHMHNCDSTSANYRYYYANYAATVQQETTVVRSGGLATNGVTPISWGIVSTANAKFLQPFLCEEIAQWNESTGAARTATIYLTTNTTLNNDEFWGDLEYLGNASFPISSFVSSRKVPLASAAALTSDSSTYGGSITNKYKISFSFTPQMKGLIKARLYLGKPSVTVYVEPFIYITDATGNLKSSGRSYLVPGYGYMAETAPSFLRLGMGAING